LRLPSAFGHRLREVGEQHRQPQPERDLQLEPQPGPSGDGVGHQPERRQTLPPFRNDEHHRILRHRARVRGDTSTIAPRTMATSQIDRAWLVSGRRHQKTCPFHQEVLDDRAEAEGWKNVSANDR
jgi:hypothetical protein